MIDGHTSTHTAGAATVPKRTLEMLNGSSMTYTAALDTDKNIIREAEYVAATKAQDQELWKEKNTMAALVKHHLGLGDRDTCIIAGLDQWIRGSFNVCIPIEVRSSASASRRLILRCAMPHKLAEAEYPGSVDEKMGCEVGTYGWMQEYCPEIRIPHLYGFGFSDRRHVRLIHVRPIFLALTECSVHARSTEANPRTCTTHVATLDLRPSWIPSSPVPLHQEPNHPSSINSVHAA